MAKLYGFVCVLYVFIYLWMDLTKKYIQQLRIVHIQWNGQGMSDIIFILCVQEMEYRPTQIIITTLHSF